MSARTITEDEVELIYYFHYMAPVKYSISEIMALFSLSKKSVCNYLNKIKSKVEKDSTLATHISDKYRGYESITKYRKDLKEEIQEINYNATVREFNIRLIEIEKKIESLKNFKQPVSSNIDIFLQGITDKVDKISKGLSTVAGVLKIILNRLDEIEKKQGGYYSKLDEIEKKQEGYNSKLDEISKKVDEPLNSYRFDCINNDINNNSYPQPDLREIPYSDLQAIGFLGKKL